MRRIHDIANVLVERHHIDEQEALSFLEQLVQVINDGLRTDKQVKIKGFGTFKVIGVGARESIDVSTGRRITIEEHEKVSFVPDTTLRDKVNAPFSQFETFTLNEDVDFSEIDSRYPLDVPVEPTEVVEKTDEVEVLQQNATDEAPSMDVEIQPQSEPVPNIQLPIQEETEDKNMAHNEQHEEMVDLQHRLDIVTQERDSLQESVGALKLTVETLTQMKDSLSEAMKKSAQEKEALVTEKEHLIVEKQSFVQQNTNLIVENSSLTADSRRQLRIISVLSFLLGAALVAVAMLSYYYYNNGFYYPSAPEVEPVVVKTRVDSLKSETVKQTDTTKKADTQAKDSETKKQAAPSGRKDTTAVANYDSDIRIRMGAYRIVGVAQTLTVKEGQTLYSISKNYLGPGMECYVEAINGKKEFRAGEEIKIPKLELKKKASN